jgi:hypothetical protein
LTAAAARFAAETLVLAAPPAALLWLSGQVELHIAAAAMAALVAVVMASGRLLLRAAHVPDMPAAAAWVLGVFATATAVYALAAWLHLVAASAFALWAAGVGAWALFARRREQPDVQPDAKEFVALAVCGALTFVWCRHIAGAPQGLAGDGVLAAWGDYFVHGGAISSFGDPRAVGRQAIEFADFPARAYHHASYLLPAALAAPLDLPGLPLATSVWLPLGFLTMCAGAYALGAVLAGAAGGLAALAAIALIPDASIYGLRNGVFSFHWNVVVHPGAAYGTGLTLFAFALLRRWTANADARTLLVSAALSAGTGMFRVHAFLVGFPAWLASAALATRFVQQRKLTCFSAAALAFAVFAGAYYAGTGSAPALPGFLRISHTEQEPTAYTGWYQALLDAHGPAVTLPAGLLLVLAASLGGLLLVYPLVAVLVRASGKAPALEAAPAAAAAAYALLMIAAPMPPFGYPHDLAYNSFALPYAVLAVWTAATLVAWVAAHDERRMPPRLWRALVLSAVAALPLLWTGAHTLAAPKFAWGLQFDSLRLAPGMPQAAAFLREHSRPGQIFAVQGLSLRWADVDAGTQLGALTGMPAYLARPAIQMSGSERASAAMARHGALRQVAQETSPAAALRRLRELGIAWYVVADQTGPRWDPERRAAAFTSGSVAVYSAADTRYQVNR